LKSKKYDADIDVTSKEVYLLFDVLEISECRRVF